MKNKLLYLIIFASVFIILLSIPQSTHASEPSITVQPAFNQNNTISNNTIFIPDYTALPTPTLNFTLLQVPPIPGFPIYTFGWGFALFGHYIGFSLKVPNVGAILNGNWFFSLIEWGFEWIGVQIGNAFLYLVQAIYLFFAYIEYFILQAVVDVTASAGIFALPIMVFIVILIGIVVELLISVAQDVSIVGAGA